MKQYDEVFELIENGEWDLTDFSVWLNDYNDQAWESGYTDGFREGYDAGYKDGYANVGNGRIDYENI